MPTKDVGCGEWLASARAEKEACCASPGKALEKGSDRRVHVYLPMCTVRFESPLHSGSMNLLFDRDGPEVWREVLFDFQPQRFPYTQTCCSTEDEQRPLSFVLPRLQRCHCVRGEARRILLLLLHNWQINEVMVPLSRM
jgi:hypothetical protein